MVEKQKYFYHKCECDNCHKVWNEKIEFGAITDSTFWHKYAFYKIVKNLGYRSYISENRIRCHNCGTNLVRWKED